MADWHVMICGQPPEIGKRRVVCPQHHVLPAILRMAGLGLIFGYSLGIGSVPSAAQEQQIAKVQLEAYRPSNSAASPVGFFRQLLAMDDPERERALAGKSEAQRKLILAKLDEYEALTPDGRELRLRYLELRYFLQPLMRTERTNREAMLVLVPPDLQKLVEERLAQWDLLPLDLQREVLEADATRDYFLRMESSSPAQREAMLKTLPTARRSELEEGFAQWRALTAEQKEQYFRRLNRLFELTEEEKQKMLRILSEPERGQMQRVLAQFEKLPVENRRYCVQAFYRFANLSSVEKELFLKSAERWQSMPPSERQAWRDLVTKLPPLPPGIEPSLPPPLPQ